MGKGEVGRSETEQGQAQLTTSIGRPSAPKHSLKRQAIRNVAKGGIQTRVQRGKLLLLYYSIGDSVVQGPERWIASCWCSSDSESVDNLSLPMSARRKTAAG